MNEMNVHITADRLQAFLDRSLVGTEAEMVQRHIDECPRCAARYRSYERFDRSLRKLPVERVNDGFTREVMGKLHLAPPSPFGFRILENLAYVFGLLIVLGVMTAVFLWTGVIDTAPLTQTEGAADSFMADAGVRFTAAFESLTRWLTEFFPFAFSKSALGISGFLLIALFLLLIVDRLVGRRYVQRT